ncbi:MAG: CPBP family intramembrane glutamic endopeptidase [Deinococcota bacterium]
MKTRYSFFNIRAGGWIESLLLFGLPGILLVFTFEWLNPWLQNQGMALVWSFTLSLYLPLLVLGVVAVVAYHLEGNAATWPAFCERMRLQQPTKRVWLWSISALVVALLAEALLEPSAHVLARLPFFAPPALLPSLFDPNQPIVLPPNEYLGVPLSGNAWLIALYAVSLAANIFGEELLWRSFLLPRQELVFGKWAWLVNGILWIFVLHFMMRWMWLTLIPTGLLTPLIAQHVKNTWAAIIIHGFGNGVFLILIAMGVLGI